MLIIQKGDNMNLTIKYKWVTPDAANLGSRSYVCGYCGNPLASQKGFRALNRDTNYEIFIYICHFCTRPTFFDTTGTQFPGTPFGNEVKNIPDKSVNDLYQEARRATSANCNTAAVLCCRKLLMHIAVDKKAAKGRPFAYYVKYLVDNYMSQTTKVWVDYIKEKGNEANHEIKIIKPDDAKKLIDLSEMLLRIIYEFPSITNKIYPEKEPEEQEDKTEQEGEAVQE